MADDVTEFPSRVTPRVAPPQSLIDRAVSGAGTPRDAEVTTLPVPERCNTVEEALGAARNANLSFERRNTFCWDRGSRDVADGTDGRRRSAVVDGSKGFTETDPFDDAKWLAATIHSFIPKSGDFDCSELADTIAAAMILYRHDWNNWRAARGIEPKAPIRARFVIDSEDNLAIYDETGHRVRLMFTGYSVKREPGAPIHRMTVEIDFGFDPLPSHLRSDG